MRRVMDPDDAHATELDRARVLGVALLAAVAGWAQMADLPRSAAPEHAFVIEFPAEHRGLVGGSHNVAFTLDFEQHRRTHAAQAAAAPRDLVTTFDLGGCARGQERMQQPALALLGPGDGAWLDHIEVSLGRTPGAQTTSGGVCYGLRRPSGLWSWHWSTMPLQHDAEGDRARVELWIKDGPVDAVKLVFDNGTPRLRLERVAIAARPYPSSR